MATVPRATDPLPTLRGKIISAALTDSFNNILNFLEANNIDDSNVDYSSTDGIGTLRFAQSFTGRKTFDDIVATSIDHTLTKIKVFNDQGSALAADDLLYVSGYSSTNLVYAVKKAVATQSNATTFYATLIADAAIADQATGNAVVVKPLTGLNTTGLTVGGRVWLSGTAGSYNTARTTHADVDYAKQVVGFVVEVHATTGRIILTVPGAIVPWSIAQEVGD